MDGVARGGFGYGFVVFEFHAGEVGDSAGVGAFCVLDLVLDSIVLDICVDEDGVGI